MAEQISYSSRSGPRDRHLRVGDDEREAVSGILRREHLAGRLGADEFHERLGRCLEAKTYAELDELIADFPRTETERWQPRPAWHWRAWPLLFLPLVALAIVFSHGRAAWLAVPFFFWFVVRPFFWGYGWRRYGGYGWRSYGRRS
jgi:uncharacterized protein DUF1707